MAWLTDLGYRVWYDEIDMGNNITASMSEGIKNSTVVLVCANSTYQGRPNCMYELRETARLYPDKIVRLLVEGVNFYGDLSQQPAPPNRYWKSSVKGDKSSADYGKPLEVVVSQEMEDIIMFPKRMLCDIGQVAQDPLWQTPDQVTPDLLEKLKKAVQPLVAMLSKGGCQPSMPKQ